MTHTMYDNNIDHMHIDEAADTILDSSYGIHAIIVYFDTLTLREFFFFLYKEKY